MATNISLAVGEQDVRAARRFWYDVYVTEMGRHTDDGVADHNCKELQDPFQDKGNLFLARENDRVVGTVLSTYDNHADFGYYDSLYRLQSASARRGRRISLTNKLIVAPEKRRTALAMQLAAATYRQGLLDGIQHNYIDCNAHLLNFFLRIGFRTHRGWVLHKDYGLVYSLVFNLEDIEYLKERRSPLVPQFLSIKSQPEYIRRGNISESTISHP